MKKDLLIYLCGVYNLGFAIFHLCFWGLFHWKSDLRKISKVNRGILQIANTRLIYTFLFSAWICFYFPVELYSTSLGKVLLIGASVFWFGRMIEQFVFLRIRDYRVHLLTALFFLGGNLFLLPLV